MFHLNNYIALVELSYDSSAPRGGHLRHIQDAITYVVANTTTLQYLHGHQGGVERKFKRKQTQFSPFSWHTTHTTTSHNNTKHHQPHRQSPNNSIYPTIKTCQPYLNIIFIYRSPPFAISPACGCTFGGTIATTIVRSVYSMVNNVRQSNVTCVCTLLW